MTKNIKAYNGCPISEEGTRTLSIVTAQEIVEAGELHGEKVDIFVPAVQPFNDKSKGEPTPRDIYKGDITQLKDSDIVFFNITGGMQDGTNAEIGVITGMNEALVNEMVNNKKDFDVFETRKAWDDTLDKLLTITVAYSTSGRVPTPQHFKGIASASVNHLILAMLDEWGVIYSTRQEMLNDLRDKGISSLRESLVKAISDRIVEEYELKFADSL